MKALIGGLGASSKPSQSASHTIWAQTSPCRLSGASLAVLLLCSGSGLSAVLSARRRSPPPRSHCPSVTVELAVRGAGHPGFVSGRSGVFGFLFFTYECLDPAWNQ